MLHLTIHHEEKIIKTPRGCGLPAGLHLWFDGRKIQCVVCEHAKTVATPRKPEHSTTSPIFYGSSQKSIW
jgi:hypothetical protein